MMMMMMVMMMMVVVVVVVICNSIIHIAQLSQRNHAAGCVGFGWVVGDGVGQAIFFGLKFHVEGDVLHQPFVPYNFATESFHTKKLCSTLSSRKAQFLYVKLAKFAKFEDVPN